MLYFSDYHVHTNFSPDSRADMQETCRCAVDKGMDEICFTDHLEYGEVSEFWQKSRPYDGEAIRAEIEKANFLCGGKLLIKHGVELAQWVQDEDRANEVVKNGNYDFVLASIHSPQNFTDVSALDYSDPKTKDALDAYYSEMLLTVKRYDFDSVAHLTLPIRYAKRKDIDLDLSMYYEQFREIFKVLAERGRGIEINTSGFRGNLQKAIPDKDVLKIYRDCGGELVTLGSDAHFSKDIGEGIKEGQALLREVGFKYFSTFTQRKAEMKKLAL